MRTPAEYSPTIRAFRDADTPKPLFLAEEGGRFFHELPRSDGIRGRQLKGQRRTFGLQKKVLQANRETREPLRICLLHTGEDAGEALFERPERARSKLLMRWLPPFLDHVREHPVRHDALLEGAQHHGLGKFRGDLCVLKPEHALLLLLAELRKRSHRFGESFRESERTILRVLPCHDDFAAKREIVTDEHARSGTETDGQTFVDRITDADREVDAVCDGGDEVEDTEEPGV